ncbi:hypothetical protein AUEXF2481DRAFT_9266 [Aureobasidium subglaciale EXF-2481]|uniref:Defective in cullin neddylation protein n=1 Tax=Aureobasidium subglaciale (strain EXF-2481) TaxID=1043005 RepID=A0A074XYN0_AURSE|nr:uncharacterized protein AUEXF2481DRAFT_9266 [Aureobasidium subglaciale EXF-2481]KAI5205246.1 DUF298-domain-containing protein [Aureobasidium subglaciale]KAI5224161.1 DUF298-domain-containing protein [Aureobasidium subglaciale]KAI5228310.1 DUF298-domain-containing protein [Aureobasidium subglaciale]KAI5262978.1 DUF298-domain-containing protein [Aureobasidium subglaciale]KEQ90575.1 hypothetical protein AUEXF2481DRAFT_9266 [Aureobasidium subglaciale EXF-2481]
MPAAYTSAQKTAIQSFVEVTGTDKTAAARLLKQANWNVQTATNAYFQSGSSNIGSTVSKSTLNKTFDKYREDVTNEPDEINIEGTMELLKDMDVDPSDVGCLIFSEMAKSPSLGKLTRTEFVDNLAALGINDVKKMRDTVEQRRAKLADPSFRPTFKSIYKHTFILARQPGQKAVALEAATEYWNLLFTSPSLDWSSPSTPWLDWWKEFLETKYKKSVNKDMWDQTLVFAEKTLDDEALSFWSEDSAWPGVIDEFVEYVKTEKRAGDAMDVE